MEVASAAALPQLFVECADLSALWSVATSRDQIQIVAAPKRRIAKRRQVAALQTPSLTVGLLPGPLTAYCFVFFGPGTRDPRLPYQPSMVDIAETAFFS